MKRLAATCCLALSALIAGPAAAGPCRQALVLGLDVSGSVDSGEYRLQLDGLAAALENPAVAAALLEGAAAPVRLLAFEWSGPSHQRNLTGWHEVTDRAALAAFTETLRGTARQPANPATALGTALATGLGLLDEQPDCWKRTLDISGDGMSNAGPRPNDIGAGLAGPGVTVNALVIGDGGGGTLSASADLLGYFEAYVIRGPGAFALPAASFTDYEAAMVRKLLRELQGLAVGALTPP